MKAIITGYALNDKNQIELMENVREKKEGQSGSHSVSTTWIGVTFPNTSKGAKLAEQETLKRNMDVKFI